MSKMKRNPPRLDMTPMVDLAFLLVTFFMLTTKFKPQEPISVEMPSSTAEIILPDRNVILVTVAKDGRVYVDMDGQQQRRDVLKKMSAEYQIGFSPDEIELFAKLNTFGVPMKKLPEFLSMETEERNKYEQQGIPYDSANNELASWLLNSRLVNTGFRLAIKGDRDTDFEVIKKVMTTVQGKPKLSRFNLITNLKGKDN